MSFIGRCHSNKVRRILLARYAGYLVAGMERDGSNPRESDPFDDRCVKKMVFKRYVELFKESR